MKKRIMAILICAAVTLSLTGCNGNNETPNDSTPTSTSSSDTQSSSTGDQSTTKSTDSKPGESSDPEDSSKPDEQEPSSGAIDWNTVPYADEKDFIYKDVDGGVGLTQYLGSDKIVKVPPAVDGEKSWL